MNISFHSNEKCISPQWRPGASRMGPEVLLKVDPAGLDSETERNRGETHLKFNLSIFTKGSVFLPCGPVVVIYNNYN